jgi:hypothetical protein
MPSEGCGAPARTAPHDKRGSNKRGQRREHDEQRIQDRHYRTSPWNVTLPVSDIDVGLTICTALSLPGDKLRSAGSTGRLIATANLYTLPGDLHVTGVGMAATVVTVEREIAPSEAADIAVVYDPPLEVSPQSSKDAVHVQIEIGYISHQPAAPNLLLDTVTSVRVD